MSLLLAEGVQAIKVAVREEKEGKLSEAILSYQVGIRKLLQAIQLDVPADLRLEFVNLVEGYVGRVYDNLILEKKQSQRLGHSERSELSSLEKRIVETVMTEKPNVCFDDICGFKSVKKVLEQAIVLPMKFPERFLEEKPYKGFLLFGAPGNGKSLVAKCAAGEAKNATFFSISASDLLSNWQGESEGLVRALFQTARRKKPSVIFFDEIDSLVTQRSDGDSESSRRVKAELFVQMDGVKASNDGLFILAATTTPESLDYEFLRRFDKLIYVPLPSYESRLLMFKKRFLGNSNITLPYLEEYAKHTEGMTGSEIDLICRTAKLKCIAKLQDHTYFRKIIIGGKTFYSPCQPSQPDGIKMSLRDIPSGSLRCTLMTTQDDVEKTVAIAKPQIDSATIRKLENYAQKMTNWNNKEPLPRGKPVSARAAILDAVINFWS